MSIKSNVKGMIHKKMSQSYQKEKRHKEISYATWIEEKESKIKTEFWPDFKCVEKNEDTSNCLKIEKNTSDIASFGEVNDGELAKTASGFQILCVKSKKPQDIVQRTAESSNLEFCQFLDKKIREKLLNSDYIICQYKGGYRSEIAQRMITDLFDTDPRVDLIYGDEDHMDEAGIRVKPWFKPDWSPDLFEECFYFGGLFAIRSEAILRLSAETLSNIKSEWDLCREVAKACGGYDVGHTQGVAHIDEILYHRGTSFVAPFSDYKNRTSMLQGLKEAGREAKMPLVSIIIPSKDQPCLLEKCLRSIVQVTEYTNYELIVVDNGSNAVNRDGVNELQTKVHTFTYIYEAMDFNFSAMCNKGAEAANGELLLFLNDDIEITRPEWLSMMVEKAMQKNTGAVGLKLYYPESKMIQHDGITNINIGPVHKLQFQDDEQEYYFGYNRYNRNVLAVTGACLMVSREKFFSVGGFPVKLPVAFNDVSLCFSLYEKGYSQVVINHTFAYHHESVSRGADEDRTKLNRLLAERRTLYEMHPTLENRDPYYHKYLAADILDTGFSVDLYGETKGSQKYRVFTDVHLHSRLEKAIHPCVKINLEYSDRDSEADSKYWIFSGNMYLIGSDNAFFEKRLYLVGDKKNVMFRPDDIPRPDVATNLSTELNVDLAGFKAVIRCTQLPEGSYQVWAAFRDRVSGKLLTCPTNRYISVEKE